MRGFFASLHQVDESITYLFKRVRIETTGCGGLARVVKPE